MVHESGTVSPNEGSPADYSADHPTEHPSDWGWHGDFGKVARVAGWVVVVCLLLLLTTTHYNDAGSVALILTAGILVIGLIADIQFRKNSWRK